MKVIRSLFKLDVYKIRESDNKLEKLLNTFLGIGICKHCGYEHHSIDKYCEVCLEAGFTYGITLYHFSNSEYKLIKKGVTSEHTKVSSTH